MRTLDVVIKAIEICKNTDINRSCKDCPMPDDQMCINYLMEDALYYLKEYRSDMQIYAANQKLWENELQQKIKDFGDAKDRYIARLKELDIGTLNEPLTWDELRQMEGKPVWIKLHYKGCKPWSGWEIVDEVSDKWMTTHKDDYDREKMCKYWQAYRKEK